MKIRILSILFLLVSTLSFAQAQKKIYYDANWKIVSYKSSASFYRVVKLDSKGVPIGKVRDYFISGKLQWEGQISYMDKYDNSKDIQEGLCVFYKENGHIEYETYYVYGDNGGIRRYFYYQENGLLSAKIRRKDGVRYGESTWYQKDGATIKYKEIHNDGNCLNLYYNEEGELTSLNENAYNEKDEYSYKPLNKFWVSVDPYTKDISKKFNESFDDSNNPNGWFVGEDNYGRYSSYTSGGITFSYKQSGGHRNAIKLDMAPHGDYSISIKLKHLNSEKKDAYGLVWGLRDWDNYNQFSISGYGTYRIMAKHDGFVTSDSKWKSSSSINKRSSNVLRVKRIGDKMYFAINGDLIHTSDAYSLSGPEVGFMVSNKGVRVLMEGISVTQDMSEDDLISLIAKYFDEDDSEVIASNSNDGNNSNSSSTGSWKATGSGFFISEKGYIATNYHVVEDMSVIQVEYHQKGIKKTYSAEVVVVDKNNDLAIIQINDPNFRGTPRIPYVFDTRIKPVGTEVFALGYPETQIMGREIKFTDGKISSKTGIQGDIVRYQISVPITHGNSGGPLFDNYGNLVGITSSGLNVEIAQNANYAIKASYLKSLIDVMPETISLPNDSRLRNAPLTQKIKELDDFIPFILVK